MKYHKAKVYFDGSHYIAIPHTKGVSRKRIETQPEVIDVPIDLVGTDGLLPLGDEPICATQDLQDTTTANTTIVYDNMVIDTVTGEIIAVNANELTPTSNLQQPTAKLETQTDKFTVNSNIENKPSILQTTTNTTTEPTTTGDTPKEKTTTRKMTFKQLFESLYEQYRDLKKADKIEKMTKVFCNYFPDEQLAKDYVERNLYRKYHNLQARKVRMYRKAYLQEFNYFCTFTYNDELHTEDSFKTKLKYTLWNLSKRKGWKYIGVWERSPENKRLHFHGIFYIPNGQMIGSLEEVASYSFAERKRIKVPQNTHFKKKFGMNKFDSLGPPEALSGALSYILKYIEKSGEKIVYSRGLHQYLVSDILENDVVCTYGAEDKKLLLFDNFHCIDDDKVIGRVSKETIAKMPKCN